MVKIQNKHSYKKELQNLPDDIFFDKLYNVWKNAESVEICWNGEPLLSKNLIKKIAFIRKINPEVDLVIITNWTLLNSKELIKNLIKYTSSLHISLNWVNNYWKIMIWSNFNMILKNLSLLYETLKESKKKLKIILWFILMKSNIDDIINISKIAHLFNFYWVAYKNLAVFNKWLENEYILDDKKTMKIAKEKILEAKKIYKNVNIDCEKWPELNTGIFMRNNSIHNDLVCIFPWKMVEITFFWETLLCYYWNISVWNLINNSFEEIWFWDKVNKYRNWILKNKLIKECKNCIYLHSTW